MLKVLSYTEKYLNNLHDTDHLHLIIMIALQVAGPGGYFGVHHGALGQIAMDFTQTSSTARPIMYIFEDYIFAW